MRRLNYILIAVAVLAVFVTFFFFSQSRSTGNVVECNAPSVFIDGVCCMDSDSDFVCDAPEENVSVENSTVAETPEVEYKSFKARMYLSPEVLASESNLPENPEKISRFTLVRTDFSNGKKYYGKYSLYTYLDGVYNEDVRCDIEEYYGSELSERFSVEILAGQKSQVKSVGYAFDETPDRVRYDLTCIGFNGGKKWKDSYIYDLAKN